MSQGAVFALLLCTLAAAHGAITVEFGSNIAPRVQERLRTTIANAPAPFPQLLLSFGNTETCKRLIPAGLLEAQGPEGFVLAGEHVSSRVTYCANGNPHPDLTRAPSPSSIGAVFASYDLLDRLGILFLHPLDPPAMPANLTLLDPAKDLPITEKPYWEHRGFHIHTEHPLELTDVLNGFDVNITGHHESFESMLPQVESMFEWLVANKQNRVEWILLYHHSWDEFASSKLRQGRLRAICQLAHNFGIGVAGDVPIAIRQQHAWYMVDTTKPLDEMRQQIRERIDWLMDAGFDFLNTESGYSEFTHPTDDLMLALMNEYAMYTASKYNREAFIKIHCSTGQFCTNYTDPRTGEKLNFNFLPMFADESLGVMPHTVQAYAFEDPAPVYGNEDFNYMKDFLFYQAQHSKRPVVYHGETAYWVNVDIDVPLFLPLYGDRRLKDLRTIAQEERAKGFRMDGQMNFDSGWEWGAFISDVVTARAAWNPLLNHPTQAAAFRAALDPVGRAFGPALKDKMIDWLARLVDAQYRLLVLGEVKEVKPPTVHALNGFAYLVGFDAFADLPAMLNMNLTQPNRIKFGDWLHSNYAKVAPLLSEMDVTFSGLLKEIEAMAPGVPPGAKALYSDIADAMRMTSLRATFMRSLWQAAGPLTPKQEKEALLNATAQLISGTAAKVVAAREAAYRVPVSRVGFWRPYNKDFSPTSYDFGYLWTVHSLYYFWRDWGLVAQTSKFSKLSPCFVNKINAAEVALSDLGNAAVYIRKLMEEGDGALLFNCLAPPDIEYSFPADLYKY